MKINFQQFRMFVDIAQVDTRTVDIRKEFADIIYKSVNGVVAHDLAMRIYKSGGVVEITNPDELQIIHGVVAGTVPIFADSFKANIVE